MRIRTTVVTVLVLSLFWTSSAFAQQRHIVDPAAMRQAIVAQAATDQRTRETVLGVLKQSTVRDVAERLGLSVTRAENAVATLSSADLALLSGPANLADRQLAGGTEKIVISVTTLLLIIIIVLLLAH